MFWNAIGCIFIQRLWDSFFLLCKINTSIHFDFTFCFASFFNFWFRPMPKGTYKFSNNSMTWIIAGYYIVSQQSIYRITWKHISHILACTITKVRHPARTEAFPTFWVMSVLSIMYLKTHMALCEIPSCNTVTSLVIHGPGNKIWSFYMKVTR